MFFLAMLCMLLSTAVSPVWAEEVDNRPIVVFRVDDCPTTWRTPFNELDGMSGLEYGKLKRIPITWGVITNWTAYPSLGLSWSELRDYLDTAGGEPASHSVSHASHPTVEECIGELAESKAIINANLPGYSCTSFLQPGTWYNDANMMTFNQLNQPIGLAIQSNYSQSMAYLGGGWRIGNLYYAYGMCSSASVSYSPNLTPESLSATLDVVAATPGLVFVVMTHGIQASTETQSGNIRADILRVLMDKLAQLRDEEKLRLMGLHEAYHTAFAADLNFLPDPGFEHCNPGALNPLGPWNTSGATTIANSGGIGDSRCALVPGDSGIRSVTLILAPGRYEISWHQKVESGYPMNKQLWVVLNNSGPGKSRNLIDWQSSYNTELDLWERKSLLAMVTYGLPKAYIAFHSSTGSSYAVDNVSIVSAPLNPVISPTDSQTVANPDQCRICWNTPPDPSVTSIVIRRGMYCHPTTPTEGTAFGSVAAVAGTRQEVTIAVDWTQQQRNCVYFSIFAVKSNEDYSPPDLAIVAIDKTGPTEPQVSVLLAQPSTVQAQWTCSDPESEVVDYQYAIGTSPSTSDVLPWAGTQQTQATASDLPVGQQLYCSVKARNFFGYWSQIGCRAFIFSHSISDALNLPDGSIVQVAGIVTRSIVCCGVGGKAGGLPQSFHVRTYVRHRYFCFLRRSGTCGGQTKNRGLGAAFRGSGGGALCAGAWRD